MRSRNGMFIVASMQIERRHVTREINLINITSQSSEWVQIHGEGPGIVVLLEFQAVLCCDAHTRIITSHRVYLVVS